MLKFEEHPFAETFLTTVLLSLPMCGKGRDARSAAKENMNAQRFFFFKFYNFYVVCIFLWCIEVGFSFR